MSFNLYSKYYDLLYSDKDYSEESDYIMNILIDNSTFKNQKILELGGGSGNHALYLSKYFDEIFGVELSSSMVEIAKGRNIPNYRVKQGDICTNHYPQEKFDCAISLFHVISYLNTNEQIINCFNAVNEQLKTGGVFVFDVWYTPAVYHLKPETRVKKMEDNDVIVTRIAQPTMDYINCIVNVNYSIFIEEKKNNTFTKIEEFHKMRHFTSQEIKLFAEICGFELITSEEFLTKRETSNETWGVLYVLKKK
jgi:SAM-dependent methyltransferase